MARSVAGYASPMATTVDREQVQRLAAAGAVLVDVLPAEEFEQEHLPAAVHLPLRHLDAGSAAQLPANRPLVVYCFDAQ